jgi:hypothetical protein
MGIIGCGSNAGEGCCACRTPDTVNTAKALALIKVIFFIIGSPGFLSS